MGLEVKPESQADGLRGKILGVWTDGNTENATFEIGEDSILYVERLTSYKHSLTGDSLKIMYPDYVYAGRISFKDDTLVMDSNEGTSKFRKFKN